MKIKSSLLGAVTVLATAAAVLSIPAVHAAPSHTLNVKLGTGVEVFTSVKLNQTITRETVLPYLRNVRAHMYEQNVLFNGEKLQDVVADAGLSKDEYVNGLQWSGDMERIAVQRAVEEYYSGTISHDRPTGEDPFTATLSGNVATWAESLCTGYAALELCLNEMTYGEEGVLNSAEGHFNAANSHLHSALNPEFLYVGAGGVDTTYAFEHSKEASESDMLTGFDDVVELSIAIPESDVDDFRVMSFADSLAPNEPAQLLMQNSKGFSLPGTIESSNPDVASIMGNYVVGVDHGDAIITFRSHDGTITADTILTVIGDPVPPIDIPVPTPVIPPTPTITLPTSVPTVAPPTTVPPTPTTTAEPTPTVTLPTLTPPAPTVALPSSTVPAPTTAEPTPTITLPTTSAAPTPTTTSPSTTPTATTTTPRAPQNPSDDSSSGWSGSSTGGSILLVLLSILAAVGIGTAMISVDALPAMWF